MNNCVMYTRNMTVKSFRRRHSSAVSVSLEFSRNCNQCYFFGVRRGSAESYENMISRQRTFDLITTLCSDTNYVDFCVLDDQAENEKVKKAYSEGWRCICFDLRAILIGWLTLKVNASFWLAESLWKWMASSDWLLSERAETLNICFFCAQIWLAESLRKWIHFSDWLLSV